MKSFFSKVNLNKRSDSQNQTMCPSGARTMCAAHALVYSPRFRCYLQVRVMAMKTFGVLEVSTLFPDCIAPFSNTQYSSIPSRNSAALRHVDTCDVGLEDDPHFHYQIHLQAFIDIFRLSNILHHLCSSCMAYASGASPTLCPRIVAASFHTVNSRDSIKRRRVNVTLPLPTPRSLRSACPVRSLFFFSGPYIIPAMDLSRSLFQSGLRWPNYTLQLQHDSV